MQNGMVVEKFSGGTAAFLYILFGLVVIAVIAYLQRSQQAGEGH